MTEKDILKQTFDKWVYKLKLVETYGSIFNPFYERPDYRTNGIVENIALYNLNEGLIKSYPSYKFKEVLSKKFKLPMDYINAINASGNDEVDAKIILYFFEKENIKELKKVCDACGYFVAKERTINDVYCDIEIEPKFDTSKMTLQRFSERFDVYTLYHICKSDISNKILANGLTPRSNSKKYDFPDRVYLFPQYNKERFVDFAKQKYQTGSFDILAIDINKMLNIANEARNLIDIEFDVNYGGYAIYTTSNIHPSTIEKISTFKI